PIETRHLYQHGHLAAGGYMAENRQGAHVFHPLVSISLGVVNVTQALPYTSYQLAEFAALAKSESKKIPGNSLFVEQRSLLPVRQAAFSAEASFTGPAPAIMSKAIRPS